MRPKIYRREQLKNVGFISTRFYGTDGVSLETQKWAHVLEEMGLKCYYLAGQLDTDRACSILEPLADFKHAEIEKINKACFGASLRPRVITRKIHDIKILLKDAIYNYIDKFDLQLLISGQLGLGISQHVLSSSSGSDQARGD